ncbi:Histidine kinase [Georgenia satyanarayanai]|uniref:histidine kinase n=1 Tax=Georgenia satyanarayanai TaxID=860221 RepID=A0A2Y9C306_9MICO|nr:histidine kinase [Georgenia satyanarayanai]PYG02166.1 histidine kinase [Georgenia satyanarayanai]SSA36983.1 Histidine kinase [Georgenia satyanarayanai]
MHPAAPPAPALPARAAGAPVDAPSRPPALRPWSRIWRYLAASGIALVLWVSVAADFLPVDGAPLPEDVEARIGGALVLDALLGLAALAMLPLRRRHPVLVATLAGAMSGVSASAVGAGVVAAVSVSTWRRWRWVVPVVAVWTGATVFYELVWRSSIADDGATVGFAALAGGLAMGIIGTCVATGFYIGARRELVATLRQRAETAEREQAAKADAARGAERTRIAREMHDVLAHRISLVAMHAGALAYRTDLSREETAEAADVIQRSAHLALSELREVLGVLRADGTPVPDDGAPAEPPQPLLTQVRELVDGARVQVEAVLDPAGLPGGDLRALVDLPATTSRTAYRVVQEALTNACKHAPGSDVVVHLAGGPGGLLTVEVHNGPPVWGRPVPAAPGSGFGLVGLAERVALAGGVLENVSGPDGSFTVRCWLPWEESR